MSIILQKDSVIFRGRDAFTYVYGQARTGRRCTAFFRSLCALGGVEARLDHVQSYIHHHSSEALVRKLQSMKVRPSMAFPLTRTAFDRLSWHRKIPCAPARQISHFLAHFCPMVERGQLQQWELLTRLDELEDLVQQFKCSVRRMEDGIFRLGYRPVRGQRQEYLEKSTAPFDPDTDFSLKQYRQAALEILEGQIVQFTSQVIVTINTLIMDESGSADSRGRIIPSAWHSSLLERRVHACSPQHAIERLGQSMNQAQLEKALLAMERGGIDQPLLDEWINAYEAVNRYRQLADNLANCHYPAFQDLGQLWQQQIHAVTAGIDRIFGADNSRFPGHIALYQALIERCIANGYRERALIRAAQVWLSRAEQYQGH